MRAAMRARAMRRAPPARRPLGGRCRRHAGVRGAHRARWLIPAHQSQVDGGAVFDGFVDAHECGRGRKAVARPPWAGADKLPLTAARLNQS